MGSWCQAFFLLAFSASAARISSRAAGDPVCLNPKGEHVDFWYAFKIPGTWEYDYMDSHTTLRKIPGKMGDGVSPLDRTLNQLYKNSKELSYALWNDEPPNKAKVGAPKAHAKGVVAFSKQSKGFWLTHSVPSFPAVPGRVHNTVSSYAGANQPDYGQSFLCISVGANAIPQLVKLFEMDWMVLYGAADNANLGGDFKEWALDNAHADPRVKSHSSLVTVVHSLGGQAFTAFAKSAAFNDSIYEKLIAPHYKKDLIAETWQNGQGKVPTWSKGKTHHYTIENAHEIDLPGQEEFDETKDHSKWAVSDDGKVFCVGDINRQTGQFHRGGGMVCLSSPHIAKQMLNAIASKGHKRASTDDSEPAKKRRKSKAGSNGD